jgi:hypothetical protein
LGRWLIRANGYTNIQATKYDTLQLWWSEKEQSIAANETVISWGLYLISASAGAIYSSTAKAWAVNINGVAYSGTTSIAIGNNATKELASGTTTILHNGDGKKSFSYSFSVDFQITFGSSKIGLVSGSGSGTLTDIPRQALLTETHDFTDIDSVYIAWNNPAGNAVDSLAVCVGDTENNAITSYYPLDTTASSTMLSFTDADKKALQLSVTKGYTKTIKYYLKTVINGVSYWDTKTHTLTLVNATPTLSPVVYATDDLTKALTGDTNGNTLIRGCSDVYVGYGQQAYKGATIEKYYCRNGSQRLDGVSYGNINNVDSGEFVFAIVDSRENPADDTINKNIIAYTPLTCSLSTAVKLEEEQTANIKLDIKGSYFKGSFGAVENTLIIEYRYKTEGGEFGKWVAVPAAAYTYTEGAYTAEATITGLNYQETYIVEARATDEIVKGEESPEKTVVLKPVFDWSKTDFNFNVPVSINNVEQDHIIESGESGIWKYIRWSSGKMECWGMYTHTTALSQAWGSLFYSDTGVPRQNYPQWKSGSAPFVEKPVEVVTAQSGNYAAWLYNESQGVNGAWASGLYGLCTAVRQTSSQTFYISYFVTGFWK